MAANVVGSSALVEALRLEKAVIACTAAVISYLLWRHRRRGSLSTASVPCGVARVTRHRLVLPASETVQELALDISIAPACAGAAADVLILYVLDPEPSLFGAAALHAYSGSGYYASAPPSAPEARYRRIVVVGVGHARESYGADGRGWDATQLRSMRRRDYPPYDHPAITPGRQLNAHAARLSSAFASVIFPHVERALLGLSGPPARRALLGSSYTGSLALQVLLRSPSAVDAYILGSASVPFDPEILEMLEQATLVGGDRCGEGSEGGSRDGGDDGGGSGGSGGGGSGGSGGGAVGASGDVGSQASAAAAAGAATSSPVAPLREAAAAGGRQPIDEYIQSKMQAARCGGPGSSAADVTAAGTAAGTAAPSAAPSAAAAPWAWPPPPAAFVAYGELEREPPPPESLPAQLTGRRANVHRGIPDGSHALATTLRAKGLVVDGAHEIAGEDHTSLKLSLVSRGVGWLVNHRWAEA